MWRRLLLFLSLLATASITFVGVSYAVRGSSAPQLPPGNSAGVLPIVTPPEADQALLAKLLTDRAGARFGVTSASISAVRLLARTSAGPLYVLPGTNGLCVALLDALSPGLSCGDPQGSGDPTVAIFGPDPSETFVVGGGVTQTGKAVLVRRSDGTLLHADSAAGGFTVSANAAIRLGDRFSVVTK
jgi:hypothetical protein